MDRLGFWGCKRWKSRLHRRKVSVSADGSTWFLGAQARAGRQQHQQFQYPLMDRLGFWGPVASMTGVNIIKFQYPLMDRLGFWG